MVKVWFRVHRQVQEKMQQAAIEEGDHLAWCKQRLDELGSHTSYLKSISGMPDLFASAWSQAWWVINGV